MDKPDAVNRRRETQPVVWHGPRACATGECVEFATLADGVAVRNSRQPELVLTFTRAEWREFLNGARAGDYDDVLGAE